MVPPKVDIDKLRGFKEGVIKKLNRRPRGHGEGAQGGRGARIRDASSIRITWR
jgi:hypothetical protein